MKGGRTAQALSMVLAVFDADHLAWAKEKGHLFVKEEVNSPFPEQISSRQEY